MATNIPPHNLREVVDGTIALIDDPDISIDELHPRYPGARTSRRPGSSTAGGSGGLRDRPGRVIIRVRARAIEKNARSDRESIVVTELPYQVNKANLIEKIAELVKEKKIDGIADLRDESDREGIRVVLDLKRDEISAGRAEPALQAHRRWSPPSGSSCWPWSSGQPQVINLKEVLQSFSDVPQGGRHPADDFDLMKAEERAHILEGLMIALDHIDEVIARHQGLREPPGGRRSPLLSASA